MNEHDDIDALAALADGDGPAGRSDGSDRTVPADHAGGARHGGGHRDDGHGSLWRRIVGLLLVIIVAAGGVAVGLNWNRWFGDDDKPVVETEGEAWTGNQSTYTGKKNTDTIDIPGFDAITLKAGATTQAVNLYNPEQNTCYFRITLLLADGTQLWQSKMIAPGNGLHEIELTQALAEGEYQDAVLKYECFSMDDQTQLNGSDIKLTLKVIA